METAVIGGHAYQLFNYASSGCPALRNFCAEVSQYVALDCLQTRRWRSQNRLQREISPLVKCAHGFCKCMQFSHLSKMSGAQNFLLYFSNKQIELNKP